MKAFWYSTARIDDPATYARLHLAFEHVVVPDENATNCFPHSELKFPTPVHRYFSSVEARNDLVSFQSGQGPIGSMAVPLREEELKTWNEGWQRWFQFRYERFVHFVQVSALNDGILIGDRSIPDAELDACLNSSFTGGGESQKFRVAQALLALAGIQIILPNVNPVHVDVLLEAKQKYAEEFSDYQFFIAELLGGVWDIVKTDPSYDDLAKWADYIASTKLGPALRRVEAAIRTGDQNLCERLGYSALSEIPTLVSAQLKGQPISLVSAVLSSLLNVLAPNLAQSIRERRTLESAFGLAYLYRLKKLDHCTW